MVSAIIVAAGSSQRMGFDKLLSLIGDRPVVAHSMDRFEQCDKIDEVILVVRSDRRAEFQQVVVGKACRWYRYGCRRRGIYCQI